MLVTTTAALEGRRIARYLGLVNGEAILGVNIAKDFFASVRDVIGGRSSSYEQELQRAREIAISEMVAQAQSFGANAVIGVDLDYETLGNNGSMLMVAVAGTAVVYEDL